MTDAGSVEAEFLRGVFARAHESMAAAKARGNYPPRSVAEGSRVMAGHLGLREGRASELLNDAVLYQSFLPAALAADPLNFVRVAERLPASAASVRARVEELSAHPRLLVLVFHMSGMPLVPMLANDAFSALERSPRHCLVAPRNASWLKHPAGQWAADAAEMIVADRAGLRRLVAGLRDGSIRRLGALVDGPQAPGQPGVRTLPGISDSLGFRTGVLRMALEAGVPAVPLVHWWDGERLVIEWGPVLRDASEGIDAVAAIIEDLLRRHPEQWLNWTAARLRV